jgi:hypothetical protein
LSTLAQKDLETVAFRRFLEETQVRSEIMVSRESPLGRFGVTGFHTVEAFDVAGASPEQLDELGIRVPSTAWAREHLPHGLTLVQPELRTLRGIYHGPVRDLNMTSETNTIWSGIVVSPPPIEGNDRPPFTAVAAQWNVPAVTLPLNDSGDLRSSIWVGIDGFGGDDVMQAGTEQDVAPNGSTDYYCWYEWFPADSVEIANLPVEPGDTVYFNVRRLSNTLADLMAIVAGKGVSMTFAAPSGTTLGGQSAEWIVERPSRKVNGNYIPYDLPQFEPVHFRQAGAFTDQSHVPGQDSIILSMTENNATVAIADQVSAGSFDVYFLYPFPHATTAFQHEDTDLYVAEMRTARGDMGLGMMAGTSPSVATFQSVKWQAAFQANTGNLWVIGTQDDRGDMGLGMMAGTSPAIATVNDGNWQAAFQANTGNLWVIGTQDDRGDMGLGMMAGTSPAVGLTLDSWCVLFQANTGELWKYTPEWGGERLNLLMRAGTSPAISGIRPLPPVTGGF